VAEGAGLRCSLRCASVAAGVPTLHTAQLTAHYGNPRFHLISTAVNESKPTDTATVRLLKHARRNHQPHR
jgi:hypothetical protein